MAAWSSTPTAATRSPSCERSSEHRARAARSPRSARLRFIGPLDDDAVVDDNAAAVATEVGADLDALVGKP